MGEWAVRIKIYCLIALIERIIKYHFIRPAGAICVQYFGSRKYTDTLIMCGPRCASFLYHLTAHKVKDEKHE